MTQQQVVAYLLERGWLAPEEALAGVRVVDVGWRHATHTVTAARGPAFVVKRAAMPAGTLELGHEAAIYDFLRAQTDLVLRRVAPPLLGYEAAAGTLTLGLIGVGESLRERHARTGRYSTRLAAALGTALGRLHAAPCGAEGARRFPLPPPWALSLCRPSLTLYEGSSVAGRTVLRLLQESAAFDAELEALRAAWRPRTLTHNDLKWDNVVVGRSGVTLVDWEHAGAGDPTWDVGSALSDYLAAWALSVPLTGDAAPEQLAGLARVPLSAVQPAMRALWSGYARAAGLPRRDECDWLSRALRCAGARLTQTTYERAQGAVRLDGGLVLLLQVALNVLLRPADAAKRLAGIAPSGARADVA